MLHFDAHPDLAVCHSLPAKACFRPHDYDLYNLLDRSIGGIAEWITPLVLGAELRKVSWIKRTFSDQFDEGEYSFSVGAFRTSQDESCGQCNIHSFHELSEDHKIAVSLKHPYYLEDDECLVKDVDHLSLAKTLNLSVSTINHKGCGVDDILPIAGSFWMLDICLDYFACLNPFLSELEALDFDATNSLVSLVKEVVKQSKNEIFESKKFYDIVIECSTECLTDSFREKRLLTKYCQDLGIDCEYLIDTYFHHLKTSSKRSKFLAALRTSLPFLTLPHNITSAGEIQVKNALDDFKCFMENFNVCTDPFLITIARSCRDGFIPTDLGNKIQHCIVNELHQKYCGRGSIQKFLGSVSNSRFGCSENCECEIVFDYGIHEGGEAI